MANNGRNIMEDTDIWFLRDERVDDKVRTMLRWSVSRLAGRRHQA